MYSREKHEEKYGNELKTHDEICRNKLEGDT